MTNMFGGIGNGPPRPPSSSASAPQPTSPPPFATTSLSSPTATTNTSNTNNLSSTNGQTRDTTTTVPTTSSTTPPPLHQTLPSAETQRHVAEARAAVVASMSNMVDSELQSRASILHANAASLDKQERDVLAATEGLRREREKLAREADGAARRLKEVGNVQNWAEVLERGFLILEETVRLANGEGSEDGDGGSCSCSCSECGSVTGDEDDREHVDEHDVDGAGHGGGHDKQHDRDEDVEMMTDSDALGGAWSDASRSLMEPESSTGTGRAKGSETGSMSTTS